MLRILRHSRKSYLFHQITHFPLKKEKIKWCPETVLICVVILFSPTGTKHFSTGNHCHVVLQRPLACARSSKWCCTSGWAWLYWRLASDWWGSKLGVGRVNGPAGRLAMQPWVGYDSEHSTGTRHWQAHSIMLKGMTYLASGFGKCQKSVYKQCTSPTISRFRRLTGSSGRERSPEVVLRSLAGQGVL